MTLSPFFEMHLRRRLPLEFELAPTWRPRSFAYYRKFQSDGRTMAFPESIYFNWAFWQLRIDVVTTKQSDLPS